MMFFAYILQSEKSGRYYVGHTSDLKMRIKADNSGKVKATKNKGPWNCVYREQFETKLQANRRELEIKKK